MNVIDGYHHLIETILRDTGMTDKMMHVHVGMAIFLSAQIVLRTRRGSVNALLVVMVAEAFNEMMDRLFAGSWQIPDTLGDIAATMVWPTAIVLVSRYRRNRWAALERRAHEARRLLEAVTAPDAGFARVPAGTRLARR